MIPPSSSDWHSRVLMLQVTWLRRRRLHIITAGLLTYSPDDRYRVSGGARAMRQGQEGRCGGELVTVVIRGGSGGMTGARETSHRGSRGEGEKIMKKVKRAIGSLSFHVTRITSNNTSG
ncbi:hypothetical protein E2C01_056636 [Portunus trituberculatus]|uniref:Uncharacterized protein n=1 Tax=Portunus trituberculatus TaxID=210409 RepID=A0A5B7GRC3_PORTR|nr:hypothetical protein [Portunus trituberculatus]